MHGLYEGNEAQARENSAAEELTQGEIDVHVISDYWRVIMNRRNFANALNQTLVSLDMTHAEFAEAVGLSQAAISRLIGGKEAFRNTYKKIFDYFKGDLNSDGDAQRRQLAMSLMQGYLRDAIDQFGLTDSEDEILGINVAVVSDDQALTGSLFSGLPAQLVLALWAMARVSAHDAAMKNVVMALAEACWAAPDGGKSGLPKGFFMQSGQPYERKQGPGRKPFRLLGGTLREIVSALRSAESAR